MDNKSISFIIYNLNKIKISFYQSNDIEELNISANKYIFDKIGFVYEDIKTYTIYLFLNISHIVNKFYKYFL